MGTLLEFFKMIFEKLFISPQCLCVRITLPPAFFGTIASLAAAMMRSSQ